MSYHLLVVLLFASGTALEQPKDSVVTEGESLTLSCSQSKTTHLIMSWYKQERKKDIRLQLVAFTTEGSGGDSAIEKPFNSRFKTTGMKSYSLPLSLENAQVEDTGTYYCASQDYTAKQMLRKLSRNLFLEECKFMRCYKAIAQTILVPESSIIEAPLYGLFL